MIFKINNFISFHWTVDSFYIFGNIYQIKPQKTLKSSHTLVEFLVLTTIGGLVFEVKHMYIIRGIGLSLDLSLRPLISSSISSMELHSCSCRGTTVIVGTVPLQLRELNIFSPISNIPRSIRNLKSLERISMWNSPKIVTLERFINYFCHLHSFKYLVSKWFLRIFSLLDSFEYLTNLQHIDLEHTSIFHILPNSFQNLTRLKYHEYSIIVAIEN